MSWRRFAYRLVCQLRRDGQLAELAALRARDRWPPDRIRELQQRRLGALLLHAFENVPYYRQPLLAAGVIVNPARPRVDLARFADLPALTRDDVRRHASDLRDRRRRGRLGTSVVTSSGTTGEALRLVWDRGTYASALAVQHWFDEWSGCVLGDPKVIIAGRPPAFRARVRSRLVALLRNETRLDNARLSPRDLTACIDRIDGERPVQVVGLPWVLEALARHAESTGRAIRPPRAVMSSFEALAPEAEATIGRAFGAPVFNRYGSREVGGIACSCGHERRLHVSATTHVVEVLRSDGTACAPGEIGEVVVTHLANRTMPLIRYRIGDLAMPGPAVPCRCGRTLPSLAEVAGRTLDAFVTADGTLVNGFYLRRFYRLLSDDVRQFQLVQLAPRHVLVRLVPRETSPEPRLALRKDIELVTSHLARALGPDCALSFEFPREISREPSGKYRVTVRMAPGHARPGADRVGVAALSTGPDQ